VSPFAPHEPPPVALPVAAGALGFSPYAPAARGVVETATSEAVALRGDLARFVATDVLQFLRLAGASGMLECERRGERVSLAFSRGRPLWACTSGRSVRLGEVLVHRGWTTVSELDAALGAQLDSPGRPVGELLRERGVAAEHVAAAVSEVFRRMVCLLSLWPDGTFRFVPGESPAHGDTDLDLELDRVLLEGLHQADLAQGTA
jgi:hypothetical protein